MSAIRLLAALLALGATQAAAQAPLKLPRTQGEIRALMRETSDPICLRCGVVASTSTLAGAAGTGAQPSDTGSMPLPLPGSSGLDPGVGTVPFGSERAKAERDRMRQGPPSRYEVVVRYDDGEKRVIYEPVKLTQDFRSFDFLSPWEGIQRLLPGDEKAPASPAKPGGAKA